MPRKHTRVSIPPRKKRSAMREIWDDDASKTKPSYGVSRETVRRRLYRLSRQLEESFSQHVRKNGDTARSSGVVCAGSIVTSAKG